MCQELEVQVAVNMSNTDSHQNTVEWGNIDWRKAERQVYKLQKRIYAASRQGDIQRVRKLQRTLMRSWSNKVLAVRRVTQDNHGKNTAGVDGKKSLSPKERCELVSQLKITGKSKPTRRVWIPKPGKSEKRPLGIPTIHDRALQGVVKATLEPEWEARFEPNSMGFRPGRSCHDAVAQIKNCLVHKAKYVLDADIAQCFDRINHAELLRKLDFRGKVKKQIAAWLKSGVIDQGTFTAISEGTPQGGVISPLLANIALHGMERLIVKEFPRMTKHSRETWFHKKGTDFNTPNIIRYADDFLILHEDKSVIDGCRDLISEWLKGIGLELKPEKTRLTHTFNPKLSEDGKAGFDFLGHHIQQYPAGRHRAIKNTDFVLLITPTKKASKAHQKEIKRIILKHRSSPQAALIQELNPVIRGWANYYSHSDIKTVGESSRQDYLTHLKLRRWAKRRCKNSATKGYKAYWHSFGSRNYVFSTREGANPLRLQLHSDVECSSTSYVKVKGDKSPYDGDVVYWSSRLGINPELPKRVALLLKKQKGKCAYCGLNFRNDDVMEVDHIQPTTLGGKDEWKNLQLLHRHCHDKKTAIELIEIIRRRQTKNHEKLYQNWDNFKWEWVEDIPIFHR